MNTAVLGGGTWGIALAKLLSENGHRVTVWSALKKEIEYLRDNKKHPNLPGAILPDSMEYTDSLEAALKDNQYIVFAVASAFVRTTAKAAAPFIREDHVIIDVAKGMEKDTLFTMTEVIEDEIKKNGVAFPCKAGCPFRSHPC